MAQVSSNVVASFGDSNANTLALQLVSVEGSTAIVELITPLPNSTKVFSINSMVYPAPRDTSTTHEILHFQGNQSQALGRQADVVYAVTNSARQFDLEGVLVVLPELAKVSSDNRLCYFPYKVFTDVEVHYQYSRDLYNVSLGSDADTHVGAVSTNPLTGGKEYVYLNIPLKSSSTGTILGGRTSMSVDIIRASYWWWSADSLSLEYRADIRAYIDPMDTLHSETIGGGSLGRSPELDTEHPVITPVANGTPIITYPTLSNSKYGHTKTIEVRESLQLTGSYTAVLKSPPRGFVSILGLSLESTQQGSIDGMVQVEVPSTDRLYYLSVIDSKGVISQGLNTVMVTKDTIVTTVNGGLYPVNATVSAKYTATYVDIAFNSGSVLDAQPLVSLSGNNSGSVTLAITAPNEVYSPPKPPSPPSLPITPAPSTIASSPPKRVV